MPEPRRPDIARKGDEILPWANQVNEYLRSRAISQTVRSSQALKRTYRTRYPFQVELEAGDTSSDQVIVRGGRWVKYVDGVRYDTDLTVDVGTSDDPDDFRTVTLSSDGTNYIILTLDDPAAPTTLTASASDVYPVEADASTIVVANVDYSTSESKIASKITQIWYGGHYYDPAGGGSPDMFQVSDAGGDEVTIRPGVWRRDGVLNGSRIPVGETWDTETYDPIALSGASASLTGNVYVYAVLQYSSGRSTWLPDDLSPGSGDWNSNVVFDNGIEYAFVDDVIGTTGKGLDSGHQWLMLAELEFDAGSLVRVTQVHRGAKTDVDPLVTGAVGATTSIDFRPEIQYLTAFSVRLFISDGAWYDPRGGTSMQNVSGVGFTYAELSAAANKKIWATVLPINSGEATITPDPALVPTDPRIVLDDTGTSNYTSSTWWPNQTDGQRLIGVYSTISYGSNNVPVLIYTQSHRGPITAYYERPDGKDSGLATVDASDPRGYSLNYVSSSESADHEGETQLYKFLDPAYKDAGPTSLTDFDDDYAVLVRDNNIADTVLKYVPLSSVSVAPSNVTPDDMDDDIPAWRSWIDEQEHNHDAHTFRYDDHDGTAGGGSSGSPARYLRHDGTASRNNMSVGSMIGDNTGASSISPDLRLMYDITGTEKSIDWRNREAYDDESIRAIEWVDRFLYDNTNVKALGWNNRTLYDENGDAIGDWQADGFNLYSGSVYSHAGNQGATVSNWTSGGIVYGADVSTYNIRVVPAGGGAPIEIQVLGRPV